MPTRNKHKPSKVAATGARRAPTWLLRDDGPAAWMAGAVLALAIVVVYSRGLNAPFIFDDYIGITTNTSITRLWPLVSNAQHVGPLTPPPDLPSSGRPLVNLSLALNYRFGGLEPFGYHVFSLAIHFGSTMLLWAIIRRTLRLPYFSERFSTSAGWLALLAALLWTLHPLQTETVVYATQRTELMVAFFYLAALYCSLRYWTARGDAACPEHASNASSSGTAWLALAVLAGFAGMASKEVMASAPIIVLLFDRTFVSGNLRSALTRSRPLYIGLAASWGLLCGLMLASPHAESAGFHHGVSIYAWWLTQCKVLWMYLKLVVWPSPLLIHYQLPLCTSLADCWWYVLPLVLLGGAVLVLLWRNHPLGFFAIWVAAILAPTSLVPILTEMAAERRMYLPLAAIVVLGVVGGYWIIHTTSRSTAAERRETSRWRFRPAAIGGTALLLAVVFGLVSRQRLGAYYDELQLWTDVLQNQPQNHLAHDNLGFYLDRRGDVANAIAHYRDAIRLNPDVTLPYYNLGMLLIKTNQLSEAEANLKQAARRLPESAKAQNGLAVAMFMAGHNTEAIEAFRRTLELDPQNWSAQSNLGMAYQKACRYDESIKAFEQALETNPKAFDIYSEMANSYALQNQREQALAMLRRGLELAQAAGDQENTKLFSNRLEANR